MSDFGGLLNTVTQGDCLEVMKEIPDGSVDMILCDLPYGTTANKWDSIIPFEPLWEEYGRVVKENGLIALMGSEPFSTSLRMSNFDSYKYDLYWIKNRPTGMGFAKYQPMRKVENICVFYKKHPTYNPVKTPRSEEELQRLSKKSVKTVTSDNWGMQYGMTANRADNKLKNPTNVLEFKSVANQGKEKVPHPTQKPVDLFEYLIRTYTNEGETVLDNCIGSGTTAVAAINTNRQFIGIEKEPEYVEIAKRRIDEALAKKEGDQSSDNY